MFSEPRQVVGRGRHPSWSRVRNVTQVPMMRGVSNQVVFDANTGPKPANTHATAAHAHSYCSWGQAARAPVPPAGTHRCSHISELAKQLGSIKEWIPFKTPLCLCKFPFLLFPSQNSGCAKQGHRGLTRECLAQAGFQAASKVCRSPLAFSYLPSPLAQSQDIGVNYLYPQETKREREKRRECKKTVISVWLSLQVSAFLTKNISFSLRFENFICVLPLEDNVIDLFKIFTLNYSIR